METYENNAYFWQKIDSLCLTGDFKCQYNIGDVNEEYPNIVYPVKFGSLVMMNENDDNIHCFMGKHGHECDAVVISANLLEKNITVKVLLGCDETEKQEILVFLNQLDSQKTVLIRRENVIPSWAVSD